MPTVILNREKDQTLYLYSNVVPNSYHSGHSYCFLECILGCKDHLLVFTFCP